MDEPPRRGEPESGEPGTPPAGDRAEEPGEGGGPDEGGAASFEGLGLEPRLLEAIRRRGYDRPTAIQRRAVPPALEGRDVLGSAQTGTGKTAAFTLPMLQRFSDEEHGVLRGLIVTPTRELARQVEDAVGEYGVAMSIEPMVVHGGVPIGPQIEGLEWGCDVLVATPGRLLDHCRRGTVDLSRVQVLVLDEADRMLDMGFIDDVRKIVSRTPDDRQTLLFSATMPNAIKSLAHQIMEDRVEVEVGLEKAAEGIREVIHPVDRVAKHELLLHLLEERMEGQVLVFARTRDTTQYLSDYLERKGVSADALHGGRSQEQRQRTLQAFRDGETRALVATNVAARGLDIRGIRHVVNFDAPRDPRDYVHRVGRTARANETGDALILMAQHEWTYVRDIEKLTGEAIERRAVEEYEPDFTPPPPPDLGGEEDEPDRESSRLNRGRRRR